MPNYLLSSELMKIGTSVHKAIPGAFILLVADKLKEDELQFRESTPLLVKLTTELIMRKK